MISKSAILICFFSKLAVSLSFSFLQGLRDDLLCDTYCYGKLQAYKAAFSLGSVLLIGLLSDHMGKRRVILCGLLVSLGAYILCMTLMHTQHMIVLYLHLIPYSILYQNISLLKATFADCFLQDEARRRQLTRGAGAGRETGTAREGEGESEYQCEGVTAAEVETETAVMGYLGMSSAASYMLGPLLGSLLFSSFESSLVGSLLLVLGALGLSWTLLPVRDVETFTETETETDSNTETEARTETETVFAEGGRQLEVVAHDSDSTATLSLASSTSLASLQSSSSSAAPRTTLWLSLYMARIRRRIWRPVVMQELTALSSGARLLLLVRLLMGFGESGLGIAPFTPLLYCVL